MGQIQTACGFGAAAGWREGVPVGSSVRITSVQRAFSWPDRQGVQLHCKASLSANVPSVKLTDPGRRLKTIVSLEPIRAMSL
jgi:hypothetical protein